MHTTWTNNKEEKVAMSAFTGNMSNCIINLNIYYVKWNTSPLLYLFIFSNSVKMHYPIHIYHVPLKITFLKFNSHKHNKYLKSRLLLLLNTPPPADLTAQSCLFGGGGGWGGGGGGGWAQTESCESHYLNLWLISLVKTTVSGQVLTPTRGSPCTCSQSSSHSFKTLTVQYDEYSTGLRVEFFCFVFFIVQAASHVF